MSDSIYQQELKALANSEAGLRELDNPDAEVLLDNPLCGDRVKIALNFEQDAVSAVHQHVKGCLLCRASAALIAEAAPGLTKAQLAIVEKDLEMSLKQETEVTWSAPWQALQLFAPVHAHRSRHGCVLLPFRALLAAISSTDSD